MRLFVNRYYPVFINVYTIWILYLLFFASFRYSPTILFEIKTVPFETINEYSTEVIKWNKLDFFKNNKKNGKAVNLSDKKCKSSRFDISGS